MSEVRFFGKPPISPSARANTMRLRLQMFSHPWAAFLYVRVFGRGFNNFGDKRLFEVEQTAVIEKGP